MKIPHPSPMSLLKAVHKVILMAIAVALAAGCFFEGDGSASGGGGGSWDDFPNPSINQCGDITPEQMKKADALLAGADPKLRQELRFFLGDSVTDWDAARSRDLPGLKSQYASALKAAPNHCGALFAHGLATAAVVVNDRLLDSLVRSAEENGGGFDGLEGLAKVGTDGGAGALFKLRRGLSKVDGRTFTLGREVIETVLLPRIDTAIQSLEKVAGNPDFSFDLAVDGDTVRVDPGEVHPILGGFKALKAALFVVAGYDWQPEADEGLPHAKVLANADDLDFDNLTADQVAALDHYTSLFKAGAGFTRIRPGWEARVASIPELLLQAVTHAQEGLKHGIWQADGNRSQKYNPYIVGAGEGADVDPADLQRGIDLLELTKKYLRGVVPIAYNDGRDTLRVDFPKLFRVDGMQGLLPHFEFLPYEQWRDRVGVRCDTLAIFGDTAYVDTVYEVRGPIRFTDAAGDSTLDGWELFRVGDSLGAKLTGKILFPDPTFGGVFPDLTNANIWHVADKLMEEEPNARETCDAMTGECRVRLPEDPSDLDRFIEFFENPPGG